MFRLVLGQKLDPLNPQTRHGIVLVAFLAWIGFGAGGFSSAFYGPEEPYLAPGPHPPLAVFSVVGHAAPGFCTPPPPLPVCQSVRAGDSYSLGPRFQSERAHNYLRSQP